MEEGKKEFKLVNTSEVEAKPVKPLFELKHMIILLLLLIIILGVKANLYYPLLSH